MANPDMVPEWGVKGGCGYLKSDSVNGGGKLGVGRT